MACTTSSSDSPTVYETASAFGTPSNGADEALYSKIASPSVRGTPIYAQMDLDSSGVYAVADSVSPKSDCDSIVYQVPGSKNLLNGSRASTPKVRLKPRGDTGSEGAARLYETLGDASSEVNCVYIGGGKLGNEPKKVVIDGLYACVTKL